VRAGGVEHEWKELQVADLAGVLDLRKAVANQDNTAALLCAEITVPQATKALLKLGYEEGCVAHVDGKQVHSRAGARFRIDDREVMVSLKAGANPILLKVTHLGRNWLLSARLLGPRHQALAFEQSKK
jgi:hypothetical protein